VNGQRLVGERRVLFSSIGRTATNIAVLNRPNQKKVRICSSARAQTRFKIPSTIRGR